MAGGEVCFDVFTQASPALSYPVAPDTGDVTRCGCCFVLPALASLSGGDETTNDKHTIIEKYSKYLTFQVQIFIQKQVAGVWTDQAEITDDTYGTYYELGDYEANGFYYSGVEIDWQVLLNAFGEGNFRFRIVETDIFLTEIEVLYPFEFCLKEYTPNRANESVKFDFYHSGIIGDWIRNDETFDYRPLADTGEFFNSIRMQGFFGGNKSSYEREYIKYQNGNLVHLKDEQIESFNWTTGLFPALLHSFIKTQILQADRIVVTDFNRNNPNIIVNKEVKPDSNYEPNWNTYNDKARVEVEFVEAYQLKRKRRC